MAQSKNNSNNLTQARVNKADEFYTSYDDIAKEVLSYPTTVWKDKIVYLPCDDPAWSNFWKYFKDNPQLGYKELWSTYYTKEGPSVLTKFIPNAIGTKNEFVATQDIESGDFRENEEIMEQANIIVTNPPFSLFRDFLKQVVKLRKEYIILGNVNAITNKNIFTLIMNDKLWFGPSIHSGDREFRVPDDYPLTAIGCRTDIDGTKYVRVKGVRWFTNIDYLNRYQTLQLQNQDHLEFFDNYDAVNCSKTKDIPANYDGIIGVPITFLDKYNPQQFEILGLDVMMKDNPRKNKRFLFKGKETYGRIMIEHKKMSKPLGHADTSAFEFHKEIFGDEPTPGINFNALYKHPTKGYYLFELLLCEESQTVDPWTSHPNRYWNKNWRKFVSLFEATQKLEGRLILINYAKAGTKNADKVKIIQLLNCSKEDGITEQKEFKMSREEFKAYYKDFVNECWGDED